MSIEEIRERIRDNLLIAIKWANDEGMTDAYMELHVDEMLEMLADNGVVLKTDNPTHVQRIIQEQYEVAAVEPLIGE